MSTCLNVLSCCWGERSLDDQWNSWLLNACKCDFTGLYSCCWCSQIIFFVCFLMHMVSWASFYFPPCYKKSFTSHFCVWKVFTLHEADMCAELFPEAVRFHETKTKHIGDSLFKVWWKVFIHSSHSWSDWLVLIGGESFAQVRLCYEKCPDVCENCMKSGEFPAVRIEPKWLRKFLKYWLGVVLPVWLLLLMARGVTLCVAGSLTAWESGCGVKLRFSQQLGADRCETIHLPYWTYS